MDFALSDNQESIRGAIAKICARFGAQAGDCVARDYDGRAGFGAGCRNR